MLIRVFILLQFYWKFNNWNRLTNDLKVKTHPKVHPSIVWDWVRSKFIWVQSNSLVDASVACIEKVFCVYWLVPLMPTVMVWIYHHCVWYITLILCFACLFDSFDALPFYSTQFAFNILFKSKVFKISVLHFKLVSFQQTVLILTYL